MSLDLSFVRAQFPAFSQPSLDGWRFFENAGGSYTCGAVIDRLHNITLKQKFSPMRLIRPRNPLVSKWMTVIRVLQRL